MKAEVSAMKRVVHVPGTNRVRVTFTDGLEGEIDLDQFSPGLAGQVVMKSARVSRWGTLSFPYQKGKGEDCVSYDICRDVVRKWCDPSYVLPGTDRGASLAGGGGRREKRGSVRIG